MANYLDQELLQAIRLGHTEDVRRLLHNPALDFTPDLSVEAIMTAMNRPNMDIIQLVLFDPRSELFDVKLRQISALTPDKEQLFYTARLYQMIKSGDYFFISELAAKADLQYNNSELFFLAVMHRRLPIVQHFLKLGKLDPRAEQDYAILLAAQNGDRPMIELLISAGLDPHSNGDLPAIVAEQNGYFELGAYLRSF